MFLEIFIPSISVLLGCIYFNSDNMRGEEDEIGRRYPCEKIEVENKVKNKINIKQKTL